MQVQIDKTRLDIQRVMQDLKTDNRKFMLQLAATLAGAVLAGVAVGRFILFHQ